MRNPGLKKRLRERLDIIGLLAFSITVLFVAFPHLLFSGNVEDIPNAVIYYRYFLAAAFIILLVLTLIFLFLRRRVALILASLLGAYALMILIFDIVYPLRIGLIEQGTETEPAAPVAGAIQIVLMVGAFFALYYIPGKVRTILGWSFAVVLLVFGLPFMFAPAHSEQLPDHSYISQNESAPSFNIYHVLFDGYFSPWLEWSLSELGRSTTELAGFTHYQRNASNYFWTTNSYTSFMTGSLWSPNMTISEWHHSTNENSIINDLQERGFSTTFYGLKLINGIRQVEMAYTDDPAGVGIVDIKLAADYWLLRVAPVALRHLVLDDHGAGPITRYLGGNEESPSGDIRALVSYRQFQKFLADEPLRPSGGQYVHVYCLIPHPPYQLDRYGNYVRRSTYYEHLHLATNMLLEFVATLKELGKFENSLIIVQADHGWARVDAGDLLTDFIQIDEATSEAISEIDAVNWTGVKIEARYLPLLLVKPPGVGGDTGDLVVNDALVQLLDLSEYIKKVIDEGDYAYPVSEQVDVYNGLWRQGQWDEWTTVGRDIMSGHINHYIIHPGGEWEICDNIPFEYE